MKQEQDTLVVGSQIEGTFYFGKNGVGFVRNREIEHVIEIPAHATGHALHKDRVCVTITDISTTTGYVGAVTSILRRDKHGYIGTLEKKSDRYFIALSDRYNTIEFTIPENDIGNASVGDRVFVTLTSWETLPVAKIEKILPPLSSIDGHMKGYALERGFDEEFPDNVLAEAQELSERGITDDDRKNRRDMREIATCTIDPDDAKDFDDALSFEYLPDGNYSVGVHIADVAHYVIPGTALDQEAQKRATSVYLVDRTIPMLPEALSNNLCSLRQDEEKLAFSVIVTLNPKGEISNTWYGRTIIKSNKRFTYDEAQVGIEEGTGPYAKELQILNNLAKIYRDERIASGALTLEKEELRFVLDEDGHPLEVRKKIRKDAHKMIEEFMLLANRLVAEFMSQQSGGLMVYRVHDRPELKRVKELQQFLSTMGYVVPIEDGVVPSHELHRIIEEAPNNDVRDALSIAIARSMAKAVYTIDNIGHYGLGFEDYTHFTSPIRRYPDIMVHRLLDLALRGHNLDQSEVEAYEELAEHSSQREGDAAEAERTSIHYMQAQYMQSKVGQIFEGMITGLTKNGMFISERDTKTEGMALYRNIKGDHFTFDPKQNVVIADTSGWTFHVGDIVKIKLLSVDVDNRLIDYTVLTRN